MKIQYKEITKNSYETHTTRIHFELTINGKSAFGYWWPFSQYTKYGVDVNELFDINNKRIQIFSNGGTARTYEIFAYPTIALKQPKDLRFTGQTLCIKHLKTTFISKIKNALNANSTANLTQEFIDYFNINLND